MCPRFESSFFFFFLFRLLWGMILAVIGAFASSGSTVLAALEADWVLVSANADSTHPCRYSNVSQEIPTYPSELICINDLHKI